MKEKTVEITKKLSPTSTGGYGGAARGHRTRTLIFDDKDRLYVSVGSVGNVDSDSSRSRIRRFNMSLFTAESGPFDFIKAEVFADGVRNEVGLAFDTYGVLWGVENGADQLNRFPNNNPTRSDLPNDIYNDNPAEELNRFPEENAGRYYGYPDCWTEYKLPDKYARGRGTQWQWPGRKKKDAWCNNPENVVQPLVAMQAHSAPLGLVFYKGVTGSDCARKHPSPMPEEYIGDIFIGFHGSWNRKIPTGYKVVRIPMDKNGMPVAGVATEPIDLIKHNGAGAKWPTGFRPVDVVFDTCGRLLISSAKSNEVYILGSSPTEAPTTTSNTTKTPTSNATSNETSNAPSNAPSSAPSNTTSNAPDDSSDNSGKKDIDNGSKSEGKRRIHVGLGIGMLASFVVFVLGLAIIMHVR